MSTGYYITYKLQPFCCAYNEQAQHHFFKSSMHYGHYIFLDILDIFLPFAVHCI